jgi:hypothetical protein
MSDLQDKVDRYIDARLIGERGYLAYYDRTATRMKRRHLQTRGAAALGAVLIPVVTSLPWQFSIGLLVVDVAKAGASLIGLGIALLLALEGVLHYKEQWQNYRGTEQYLLSQKFRFENRVDEYRMLSDEEAFRLFVLKVEKAILDENNVTLNILSHAESHTGTNTQPPRRAPR